MIIGINCLGPISQDTGGRTYLSNLARLLQTYAHDDEFIFFVSPDEGDILNLQKHNFKLIIIPHSSGSAYNRIFAEHFILPIYIKRLNVQRMYYPGNFASYHCSVPYTLAIRSMLIYNPEASECVDSQRHYYRKMLLPHSAKKARSIITPSYHTKSEIHQFLGADLDKIHVIPHGINFELFSSKSSEITARKIFYQYKIKPPYILYVSALWQYKNHDKLIQAYHQLIQTDSIPHQLVLIGRGMYAYESFAGKLKKMVEDYDLKDRVIFIDFLHHPDLACFYQYADVFVFPSLMESFGNSLFEAMASGTPVICSNTHGFPQLVKDAAFLVNPRDPLSLSGAIRTILYDHNLKNNLISNGQKLAKSLSWEICVKNTLEIIKH